MSATESSAPPSAAGSFYVTGGTLPFDAASYVPRQADHDLLDGLIGGEFCYVLNTRQMGKSSLMIRTAHHLRDQGDTVAVLDLTAVGQNLTPEQWYDGLLMSLAEQLHQEDALEDFWADNPGLGPLQRFITAIGKVVLPTIPRRLVLFVDEIDAVRSLPFPADEFFAAIRECYNRRRLDPLYEKLAFCLLGVATPADLIQDTRLSPFNIGQRILLTDFTAGEAAPLARGIGGGAAVLDRVLYWTGGHPYMTQRLCRAIAEEPAVVTAGQVDALCERLFLTKQARDTDDNLAFVRSRLLRSEVDLAALLDLYQQVRGGKKVKDDETNPLVPVLRLSGVVNAPGGLLRVRNRIYDRVFDPEWVRSHMPDAELRRQREAYRRGLLRAATVAAVVVLLMGLLAGEAFHQSGIARAAVRNAQQEARRADRSEAAARAEAEAARREAQAATAANKQAQARKQAADQAARRETAANRLARKDEATAKDALAETQRQTLLAQRNEQEAERQRGRASTAAQQATTQAGIARNKAQEALQQTNLARHTQQIADLQLAGQTWDSADGSAGAVEALLNQSQRTDARAGAERFEWALLWEKLHRGSAVTTHTAQGRYASIAVTTGGDLLSIDGQKQICDTPPSDGPDADGAATTTRPLPDAATLSSVSLSPDGTQVAVGRMDGRLDLYAEDTLRRTASWQISQTPISSVAFEPDGHTVQAWDDQALVEKRLGTDRPGERKPGRDMFQGVPGAALHAVSPALHYIAWMNTPHNAAITLRDLSRKDGAGFPTRVLEGHHSSIRCLQFSPDASRLASGDDNGIVSLWDTATGARLNSWAALSVPIQTLGFSADSNRLAAGGENGLIRIWDMGRVGAGSSETSSETSSEAQTSAVTFKGQTRGISDLVFSADGHWLASADVSGDGRVWPLNGPRPAPASNDLRNPVETIAFAPDSQTFACTFVAISRTGLRLYDGRGLPSTTLRLPSELQDGSAEIQSIAFSPDHGTAVAAGTVGIGTSGVGRPEGMCYFLQFWDWRTGRDGARWESPPLAANLDLEPMCGGLRRLAFSPDGRTVAGGFGPSYSWPSYGYDQVVKIWDTASGRERRTLTGFRNNVNAVCFSPDGRTLVVGCRDGSIRCFDTHTWAETRRLTDSSPVTSAAYSPDGRTLAVGDQKGLIFLTDTARWRTRILAAHSAMVADLAFSPDGQTLASAGWDHTLKLWDVATRRQTQTVRADNWVHRVAFSPDGTRLAYGGTDGLVRVLQTASVGQVAAWQRQEGAEEAWTPAIRWKDMVAERASQTLLASRLLQEVTDRRVPAYARPNPAANLLRPRFGQTHWRYWTDNDAGARAALTVGDDDSFTDHVLTVTPNDWQVQVTQNQLPLETGRRYVLQFRARADEERAIGVMTQRDVSPWEPNGLSETVDVTTKWQAFRLSFTMNEVPPGNAELVFLLGQTTGTVQVADAVLVPENAPPGQGISPSSPLRTAALARPSLSRTHRWADPAEERRQAQALLGEIERHQVPDQDPSLPLPHLYPISSGGLPLSLRLDSGLSADAAATEASPDGLMTAHVRQVDSHEWHVVLERTGLPLVKGRRYFLQFRARADASQTVHVLSQVDVRAAGAAAQNQSGLQGAAQYHSGLDEFLRLTPQWQAFRLSLQPGLDAPEGTSSLDIDIGQQINTLQIADMMLVPEKDAAGSSEHAAAGAGSARKKP